MYNAILFDLDGTLLPLDTDGFLKNYFGTVAPYFANQIEPELFLQQLLAATEKMIKNNGGSTNQEVFMQNFLPAVNQERSVMEPLFDQFYREEFPKLKHLAGFNQAAANAVQAAADTGAKLILATNPLFPRQAIEHRMQWAGVREYPWTLITSYENSCACKPNPKYYQGILDRVGEDASNCLMVGNDVQEDVIASTIGMSTFLVTDYKIDRGEPVYLPDYQGGMEDLVAFLS